MPLGYTHRKNTVGPFFGESRIGTVQISELETELYVDVEPMPNRTSLIVVNDSSNLVYVSTDAPFVIGSSFTVFSGEVLVFNLNPNPIAPAVRFWAKLEEEGVNTIKVIEVK